MKTKFSADETYYIFFSGEFKYVKFPPSAVNLCYLFFSYIVRGWTLMVFNIIVLRIVILIRTIVDNSCSLENEI